MGYLIAFSILAVLLVLAGTVIHLFGWVVVPIVLTALGVYGARSVDADGVGVWTTNAVILAVVITVVSWGVYFAAGALL